MGQAYVTFFRLEGPFATPSARLITEGELYQPMANRALASNVLFGSLALSFGFLSGCCWGAQQLANCIPGVSV